MIGVDAMSKGTFNMYEQGIFESVASKKQQLQLLLKQACLIQLEIKPLPF